MKILITGSSGMLGTELCEVLGAKHEIVGIDIVRSDVRCSVPYAFFEASVTDKKRIQEIFDKEKPEMAIHAAAWTDVDGCEKEPEKAYLVNVTGTQNIAGAAARKKIPVIFLSTDFVFDGQKKAPYTEADAAKPLSVYGRTKWEAEEILRRDLAHYMIVRTSWLFGKNGKNFVNAIMAKAKTEKDLRVVDDQVGSPTYAKDLAGALKDLLAAIDDFQQDIFHVSNSGQCSWYEFARHIVAEMKGSGSAAIEPITSRELARPASRPPFSVLDNGKFEKVTGRVMRPWQEALEDYIKNECVY